MKHIVCIGELLIDFIPNEKGIKLKDVSGFSKHPGGAPANVSVAAVKSGVKSYFIGQVGKDSFGDFLVESLAATGVDVTYLYQSIKANTALAFVTLSKEGERDFIFYRDPSADQLLEVSQIPTNILDHALLHFCSVSLSDYPIKEAHLKAIEYVRNNHGFICFDPNLRLSLWQDHKAYKTVINSFIPLADLLKISDDEIEFITGEKDLTKALEKLFVGEVKYIVLTHGSKGSSFYYKDGSHVFASAFKVDVVDSTGAGDAFIGTFLAEIVKKQLDFRPDYIKEILSISNAKAALTTTKYGGMSSIPTQEDYQSFMLTQKTKK